MVGIHTAMHPLALSLHFICLSMCANVCAFYTTPPTCSNLRRPETEGAMQRIRSRHSQIPDTRFLHQSHGWQLPGLLVSHMLENRGTILVEATPAGKWILEQSFSDSHPKEIASKHPGWEKTGEFFCLQRIFRNQCLQSSLLAVTSI